MGRRSPGEPWWVGWWVALRAGQPHGAPLGGTEGRAWSWDVTDLLREHARGSGARCLPACLPPAV